MHALVIGATGATGKDLLELLLSDDSFNRVDIFVRRPVQLQHPKLNTYIINFDKPGEWKHLVKGDVLFSCLGTTLKAAGSKEAQWKIDYQYQYDLARAARENNVRSYVLVSSGYASLNSPIFYSKMKGTLEADVRALNFPHLAIFNPPMLIREQTDRAGEKIALKVFKFFNALGLFRGNRPMPTKVLAKAMVHAAKDRTPSVNSFPAPKIWRLAKLA